MAQFWVDGPGTASPAGHWNTIALDLIKKYMSLYVTEAAVILGALNTAQADAFIACWDAKYTYWRFPRSPRSDKASTGHGARTSKRLFPSYVSGHATVSGAAAEILAYFFPKDAGWLRDSAKTAARSRLYGGIHTTFENETGLRLGQQVAGAKGPPATSRGVTFAYH